MRRLKLHAPALLVCACAITGCTIGTNTRLTLSDHVPLAVLDPGAAVSITEVPESSIELDTYRREWPTIWFRVPVDGTDHWFLGRTDWTYTHATVRQRRAFPTARSAIQLGGETGQVQAFEAVVAPFHAAIDAVLLLPRLIGWAAFNDAQSVSPDIDYERWPEDGFTRAQRRIWLGDKDEG